MGISAVIIAKNEEKKIAGAIESVGWADEVLVVDSGSTDRTVEVAESLGARVIHREWHGFGKQKQFATDAAANDLVLSIDADEVVTPALADEIGSILRSADRRDGYYIPRLAYYLGRPIRHCGWYPDHQLRLFDRRRGSWSDAEVHESFKMKPDAALGTLRNDILHYSIDSFAQHAAMIQDRYAPLGAAEMYRNGRSTSAAQIMFLPMWAFFHTFLIRLGFLDGFHGFVISGFASYNVFLKHLLLYEQKKSTSNN